MRSEEDFARGTGTPCVETEHEWLVLVFCSKCPEQFSDKQRIVALMYEGKLNHRCDNEARIRELESALRSALAGVSAMRFATKDLKTLEGLREMERFLNEKVASVTS